MAAKRGEPCDCGCGKPVFACGYARACYSRWDRAGRPALGPPPPMTHAARTALANEVKRRGRGATGEDDGYVLEWELARAVAELERHRARAEPLAADLLRCAAAGDAKGVRLLLYKVAGWAERALALAECVSPGWKGVA